MSAVEQQLCDNDAMLDELKSHLLRAQNKMKAQANQHCRDVQYNEGDSVLHKAPTIPPPLFG